MGKKFIQYSFHVEHDSYLLFIWQQIQYAEFFNKYILILPHMLVVTIIDSMFEANSDQLSKCFHETIVT